MLEPAALSRYAVKLEKNLPHRQEPIPVLARPFSSIATLCEDLVNDCLRHEAAAQSAGPWTLVRHMQIVSTYHILRQLSWNAGIRDIERFFEKEWNPFGPLVGSMGRARSAKRGQNLFRDRTLVTLEERLATLYRQYWPLRVDCYQLLWLALLMERPVLASAEDLWKAHDYDVVGALAMRLPKSHSDIDFWLASRQASLPYLAASIVLLRHCAESGQFTIAREIAEVICQVLAMLSAELQDRGIGASLLHYCAEKILPLGSIRIDPVRIARAGAALNVASVSFWARESCKIDWDIRAHVMNNILNGGLGPYLKYFGDPMAPSVQLDLEAHWARSLHESTLSYSGNCLRGTEPFHGRPIDMPELLARVPALGSWTGSHRLPSRPKTRPRLWFDGLGDSST